MKVLIDSDKLTDSPYTTETKEAFLFDDQTELEQFALELRYGPAGAYLISGYRGSGKTSFVNRLKEKLSDIIFVELNIAKVITYPIVVKRIIRQLFLEYQAFCERTNTTPGDLMKEFQLLYDRTFNDIVNTTLQSSKKERKVERQWKFDLKKLADDYWKLAGPGLIVLASSLGLFLKTVLPQLLAGSLMVSLIWGASTAWTITRTETDTDLESDDTSRKSLYDDEIAEHHLFGMLRKLKAAGLQMVIVFDELDKLAEDKQVKDMVNDIKPMLLSGYASFMVVAGQALYYDLEKSTFLDDIVISTLFARTFHVAFLKNATLQKYCLSLFKNTSDQTTQLANDFFDTLILQSGRNPRKLINLVRAQVGWEDKQAIILIEEGKADRLRWLSRLLQATAYVVDNNLAGRDDKRVKQDFFTAQVFNWISKMLTFDSVSFQRKDIWGEADYDEKYPAFWITELEVVWNALIEDLKNAGLLNTEPTGSAEGVMLYSWIYMQAVHMSGPPSAPVDEEGPAGEEEEEEEEDDDNEPPVIEQPREDEFLVGETTVVPYRGWPGTNIENQSLFLLEFGQLENYLRQILNAEIKGLSQSELNIGFRALADKLAKEGILEQRWVRSNAVAAVNDIRNKVAHGQSSGSAIQKEIQKSSSELSRMWAEVNEQYTLFILRRMRPYIHAERTTEGGFDIIGAEPRGRIALEVKTLRQSRLDSRIISEAIDKYENFLARNNERLAYGLLIFQTGPMPSSTADHDDFEKKILGSVAAQSGRTTLAFIDMSNLNGIAYQVEEAIRSILPEEAK